MVRQQTKKPNDKTHNNMLLLLFTAVLIRLRNASMLTYYTHAHRNTNTCIPSHTHTHKQTHTHTHTHTYTQARTQTVMIYFVH